MRKSRVLENFAKWTALHWGLVNFIAPSFVLHPAENAAKGGFQSTSIVKYSPLKEKVLWQKPDNPALDKTLTFPMHLGPS